jgi:hypothetical protein
LRLLESLISRPFLHLLNQISQFEYPAGEWNLIKLIDQYFPLAKKARKIDQSRLASACFVGQLSI